MKDTDESEWAGRAPSGSTTAAARPRGSGAVALDAHVPATCSRPASSDTHARVHTGAEAPARETSLAPANALRASDAAPARAHVGGRASRGRSHAHVRADAEAPASEAPPFAPANIDASIDGAPARAHVGGEASRSRRRPRARRDNVDAFDMTDAQARGPATVEIGASAEAVAVEALIANGYYIVERNWRCDIGELDVVARDGNALVFVEVRYRADDEHGHAALMITPSKRYRVTRVAQAYLEFCKPDFDDCRFDVVAITGTAIDIIQDAWRLSR